MVTSIFIQAYAASNGIDNTSVSPSRHVIGYVLASGERSIAPPVSSTVVQTTTTETSENNLQVRPEVRQSFERLFEKFAADFAYLADK